MKIYLELKRCQKRDQDQIILCFCGSFVALYACKTLRKTVRNENEVNLSIESVYEKFLKFLIEIMSKQGRFAKDRTKRFPFIHQQAGGG